jgi:hypothetical protein
MAAARLSPTLRGMEFPLPTDRATTAIPAPGTGPGYWAGAPCGRLLPDGTWLLAYRLRHGHDGVDETVVARSEDGERYQTVAAFAESRFDAMGMERPSLLRTEDGRWRLYTCAATRGSKHWWIDALEAGTLEGLMDAEPRTVFAGNELMAVKDPYVRRFEGGWQAWICVHPLDVDGAEDRMRTAYATSPDGLAWDWHGFVLEGREGEWDARGARLTSILPDGRAAYDGRRTAEENWFERTGLTRLDGTRLAPDPVADVRYLDAIALPDGGYRIFYEARLPDESHELRTELIPAS